MKTSNSTAQISRNWIALASLIVLWGMLFSSAMRESAILWWTSEIYTHGMLVLPVVAFFIFKKRHALHQQYDRGSFLAALALLGCVTVGTIARVGGVNVLSHAACFSALILIFVSVWGLRASRTVMFPLAMLLFAIPVGEELIPWLQEITADIAIVLLKMTGVPVFRDGLYIDIPAGKFLVAEACSGVRFFVGSIVFSALFSYLSFRRARNTVLFLLLGVLVPIVANALRVYGTILVAHFIDIKYAASADHLVYGWFFFAIVVILLVIIGEIIRRKEIAASPSSTSAVASRQSAANQVAEAVPITKAREAAASVSAVILIAAIAYQQIVLQPAPQQMQPLASAITLPTNFVAVEPDSSAERAEQTDYQPIYTSFDSQRRAINWLDNVALEIFSYDLSQGSEREMLSGENRLYDPVAWTLAATHTVAVDDSSFIISELVSQNQTRRFVTRFWTINGKIYRSPLKAKAQITWYRLLAKPVTGQAYVLSSQAMADERFERAIKSILTQAAS